MRIKDMLLRMRVKCKEREQGRITTNMCYQAGKAAGEAEGDQVEAAGGEGDDQEREAAE